MIGKCGRRYGAMRTLSARCMLVNAQPLVATRWRASRVHETLSTLADVKAPLENDVGSLFDRWEIDAMDHVERQQAHRDAADHDLLSELSLLEPLGSATQEGAVHAALPTDDVDDNSLLTKTTEEQQVPTASPSTGAGASKEDILMEAGLLEELAAAAEIAAPEEIDLAEDELDDGDGSPNNEKIFVDVKVPESGDVGGSGTAATETAEMELVGETLSTSER